VLAGYLRAAARYSEAMEALGPIEYININQGW
jgi:hypothetical protein